MPGPEARNMKLLGHDDLGGLGRCGEGTAMLRRNGRSYLYIAHEQGPANFSVVDVSDPRAPKLVHQTRLPHDKVRSNSLAVTDAFMLVAYQTAELGLAPAGIEVFDLSDPVAPRSISSLDLSGPASRGTHWVGCVDGRFAYLSTGLPTSRPRDPRDDQHPVIVDLADPSRPSIVGSWHLPGTLEGDDAPPPVRHTFIDAGFRSHNVNVYPHRPDRAYVGYLDAGIVILDISDKSAPSLVGQLDYHPPMPGFTHTVLPLFGRDFLAVTDECVRDDGADWPKLLWLADMSVETSPLIVGSAPMPPFEDFAHRGGRYGAHNLHENEPQEWSWRSEDIVFGTFFNAGVRAFDVRDPFHPVEVASFVPEPPPGSSLGASQVNDVYADAEGIVYAVERTGGGLYTLAFEG